MGVPIPYSNLGIVIRDMFESNKLEALNANFKQVKIFFLFTYYV
jgi:hypothetical protein